MPLGPVEIVVIGFDENRFDGAIVPEVQAMVDTNTVTIIDGLSRARTPTDRSRWSNCARPIPTPTWLDSSPPSTGSRASSPTRTWRR